MEKSKSEALAFITTQREIHTQNQHLNNGTDAYKQGNR